MMKSVMTSQEIELVLLEMRARVDQTRQRLDANRSTIQYLEEQSRHHVGYSFSLQREILRLERELEVALNEEHIREKVREDHMSDVARGER